MIRLAENNKWGIELEDKKGNFIPFQIIPPRQEGIDFIDCNGKYHYDYDGIISRGILIIIKDGEPSIEEIPHNTMRRIKSYIK